MTKGWREPGLRRRLVAMKDALPSPGNARTKTDGRMLVLGVDPASAGPTGYGIVESDGRRCRALHYGAIKIAGNQQKGCGSRALQEVHELICQLIENYAPDVVAVESIFSALNVRTALRLAEVRGVVLLAAAQYGLEVHSYAPREVKACITGYGHADKKQIQAMVRALLSMRVTPEPVDAADALAVALCHLQMEQARGRFGLPQQKQLAKLSLPTAADRRTGGTIPVRAASATPRGLPRIQSTR